MAMIFMGTGSAHLDVVKKDAEGKVISRTEPYWEPDPSGTCVAIGPLHPVTFDPIEAGVEFFGGWDAAHYLIRALELLKPNKQINIPDFPAMIQAAIKDGMDICDYCKDRPGRCPDCIVNKWMGDGGGA